MSIKRRVLLYVKRILIKILEQNEINLQRGSSVGRKWTVLNSEINGLVIAGSGVSCINSKLNGNLNIKDNVKLQNAELNGTFEIGKGCKIMGGVRLVGEISIGKYTSLNGPNMDIEAAIHNVKIGNFCSIARNVSIQEFNHDFNRMTTYFVKKNLERKPSKEDLISKGAINIGHDVWIGAHSVILSGSTIGTGAVIAANSVVSGIVPPYAIVAGTPAKVIKYRFDDKIIAQLLESEWWNKDEAEVIKLYHVFDKKNQSDTINL